MKRGYNLNLVLFLHQLPKQLIKKMESMVQIEIFNLVKNQNLFKFKFLGPIDLIQFYHLQLQFFILINQIIQQCHQICFFLQLYCKIMTMKQLYICILLIFLFKQCHSITKQCSLAINPSNYELNDNHPRNSMINQCPINSHCMSNKFCACDQGFIGGCTQTSFFVSNGQQIRTKVNHENYTFFQVSVDSDSFIILVFNLCHNEASQNLETIDVWDDNGSIDIFDKTNALPGSKNWNINAGCLRLNTPFLIFGKQPNGLPEDFILGIKLVNPGEIEIGLTVDIQIVDFWDLVIKILVIVGACFVLALIIGLAFILYKCRRRRLFLQASQRIQQKNIDHFKQFMPEYKLKNKNVIKDDVCSICLADFQIGDEVRMTICSHVFHKDCIDGWCKSALNCPVCRTDLDRQSLHLIANSLNLNQPIIDRHNLRQPLL